MLKVLKEFAKPAGRYLIATAREATKTLTRSPHWRSVRDKHLKENPQCAACGSETSVQVHHIKPFHLHPELELNPKNLITLCMGSYECHLRLGHGDDFRCFNPDIINDVKEFIGANAGTRELIFERAKKNKQSQ